MNTELSARIEKLEKTIRQLKTLTVLVLIGAAATLVTAAAPAQRSKGKVDSIDPMYPETLKAHSFALMGLDNKPYGRLYIKDDQPVLELYNGNGKTIWSAPPRGGFTPVDSR